MGGSSPQSGGAGGVLSAQGGATDANSGASFTGGATGSGGTTSTAISTGGSPGDSTAGGGGASATGGTASGGVPADAAPGSGGSTHAGGAAGGGGAPVDADTDVALPDLPVESGGVVGSGGSSTGGLASTGGTVATGGMTGTGGAGNGGNVGSGGATASGGTTGSGGTAAYNCASAIAPTNGLVTDFANWNATTSTWTSGTLSGNIYRYGSSSATTTAKVEGTPAGLHVAGSVPSNNYGGGGLTFLSCVTVTAFTKISFEVYGSAANCAIELQLQTYDQRPADQTPPGGCRSDGGSSCFKFPTVSQVVALATAVAAPGTTVSTTLSSMTNWSSAAAGEIVGIQWQFTPNGGTCTANATFTNITFTP